MVAVEQVELPSQPQLQQRLKRMDAAIRPVANLGRPSGCGMPGTVGATALARLLHTALQQLPDPGQPFAFADLGAGAGRMLFAAALCGAHLCVGLEICDLNHTFDACCHLLAKRGVLPLQQAARCYLAIGDAQEVASVSQLLHRSAPISACSQAEPTAADGDAPPRSKRLKTSSHSNSSSSKQTTSNSGVTSATTSSSSSSTQIMVSMIDEGMPDAVREHMYRTVSADPAVDVVLTVNFLSRAGWLHALLQQQGGFQLVAELPAPLTGGHCSPTGRVYRRLR